MAYDISSRSIQDFLDDNIKLPRFQRKQTWDDKKNFALCISIFKQFPIGVCIFNTEEKGGRTTRWLLDGRQRRNALRLLREDPENVYVWARKFIGFKPTDQHADLTNSFWEKVNAFLEVDEDAEEKKNTKQNDESDETVPTVSEPELDLGQYDTEDESEEDVVQDPDIEYEGRTYGLDLLLKLITLTHNKTKKKSGFTKPFDFSAVVKRLPYYNESTGELSSRELKEVFLPAYKNYCKRQNIDWDEEDSLFEYVTKSYEVLNETKLKNLIHINWGFIKERIVILEDIEDLLRNSKIGYVEGKNLNLSESKKIFTLLNTEGDPLKYVEILSAKAKWNKKIEVTNEDTQNLIKRLYREQLKTDIEKSDNPYVKWDLPAIFLKKLDDDLVFPHFTFDPNNPASYDKALTLGFRCLAGLYVDGVGNEFVDKLGDESFSNFEDTVNNLKRMLETLKKFQYFKYFSTWKSNLKTLTSDYVAMNFVILAYRDFIKNGQPISGTPAKQFQKRCFILWDKLIYEYFTGVWRSSSDARIHNNIVDFEYSPKPLEDSKWLSVLDEIFTQNMINGKKIKSHNDFKVLLYHMYCLMSMESPSGDKIDIDHIIPQAKFDTSLIEDKESVKHNLLNLGILSKDDNVKKSNYTLSQVTENWMKDQIAKYEFIPNDRDMFETFSNISNYQQLFDLRRPIIEKAFTTMRNDLLNN
mgnify:CR=1 FL=1